MPLRFFIILSIILVAEYYSFIVVRSAVRTFPQGWKIGVITMYVLLTLAAWSGVIFFRKIDWAHLPHFVRNLYIAFALGLTVGKILILIIMLVDDLRRLVLWIINLFYTGGTKAPEVTEGTTRRGITRSVFLSRLALGLGGTVLAGFLYGVTNRYNYHIRRIKLKLRSSASDIKILSRSATSVASKSAGSVRALFALISGKPPLVALMTAQPAAWASRAVRPNGSSHFDGMMAMAASW